MKTDISALRVQRATQIDAMTALHDAAEVASRDFTADEQKSFDTAKAAAEALASRIDRAEALEAEQAKMSRPITGAAVRGEVKSFSVPKRFARVEMKHFKGETAREDAYLSGMFLRAALFNDPTAAEWCREHGVAVSKAMTEGSNTAGGFLVPDEFENAIIDLREIYGVARQFCDVKTMSRDTQTFPRRTSGLTAYAVGENVEITASDKAWDQVSLTARKWGVLAKYSSELSEDAVISIAEDLAGEIGYAFATAEDDCLINGDGSTTYHGIRGVRAKIIDGTHTAGAQDAASGHDTFAEIDASDLATLMAKLPQYALGMANWYCSQPAFSMIFERLAQAAGGITKTEFAGKTMPSYQGYPIVISQKMPLVLTDLSDVAMLFFGDMKMACTLGDRRGITIASSTDRYFELDQLAIRGTTRFDIVAHSLGDNTTAGPLVALIGD